MIKKSLPLGLDDFKDVRRNCYYVDKTFLIRDIVSRPPSTAILYARPRRFGKSLTLSMLRYFFEASDEDNSRLFEGTMIHEDREIWDEFFSSFPVIHLKLKNATGDSREALMKAAKDCVREEYERHLCLRESPSLDEHDKAYFEKVLSLAIDDSDFQSSLSRLARFLHLHYGKRVIVLIDEYDTPIRHAYEKGFYDEVVTDFKNFFGRTLKSNEHVHYAVLTGILQVGKESIFSGLNNLVVSNVLTPSPQEAFGFSQEEVDALLESYDMGEWRDSFREWYDGYLFGQNKVYNPLSVLTAIQNRSLEPYWVNASEQGSIYALMSRGNFTLDSLFTLLSNREIEAKVNLSISYKDLASSPASLWSYLLSSGYLTVDERLGSSYRLKMPNREIESVFEDEIIERCIPYGQDGLPTELRDAFLAGDEERISSLLGGYMLDAFSYFDLRSEKEYQVMVISLLASTLRGYRVRSEVNTSMGRSDIIAESPNPSEPPLVIEIKSFKGRTSSSRLKEASRRAISQIMERNYVSAFRGGKAKEALCYGLAFAQKSVQVSCQAIPL